MLDFRQKVEQRHAELQSDLSSINAMIDAVVVPANTPKEEIQRLEAERKRSGTKRKIRSGTENTKFGKRVPRGQRGAISRGNRLDEMDGNGLLYRFFFASHSISFLTRNIQKNCRILNSLEDID